MNEIDWDKYAQEYDRICHANPYYLELMSKIRSDLVSYMDVNKSLHFADYGAGTGNLAMIISNEFKSSIIDCYEFNQSFLDLFNEKAQQQNNIMIHKLDLITEKLPQEKYDCGVMVHVLNVLPDQDIALKNIYDSLRPGAFFFVADIGKPINVLKWSLKICFYNLKKNGFMDTINLIRSTRNARLQNKIVSKLQKKGLIKMHSMDTFKNLLQAHRFNVLYSSTEYYDKIDNYCIARKV